LMFFLCLPDAACEAMMSSERYLAQECNCSIV
jgi:hypothetical protein